MTATDSAITVIEQSPDAVVEWNLDNWPLDQFNRLVPTQTLGLVTDLIRPVVQIVRLDIERDTYSSKDLTDGHRAPNARGLALLASAAGVDFPDETRTDDGSDPMRASAKVWATMVDGAGRTRTVVGSRDYVLESLPMTDAQRNRAKGYVYEHALTRARHRALRVLLGLAQSYPVAELQKPFAVVSYVPNLQHPELREAYKQALLPTVTAMYGPGAAKQLAAGSEVIDLDSGETKNVTPAPATPTALPGEKLAAAEPTEAPSWINAGKADATPTAKVPVGLLEVLRASAADPASPKGKATKSILGQLGEVFASIGWDVLHPAFMAVWPDGNPAEPTAAQARALIVAASSDPDFDANFRALAGKDAD